MSNADFFKDYRKFISFQQERYGKSTLFENEHILVGLNCLESGQEMEKHAHEVQCRFYVVLEGKGNDTIGDAQEEVQTGLVIWVHAGQPHRILNSGSERLILLASIAPSQAD
jgi:quercetin dioxygenase-like cupin family protein